MVKVHLNTTQKSRLRVISKIKCRQLQRLRERLPCKVKASHAFTGDSNDFEVACVEDLRVCLEESMRFGKARIFYENRELSDFDGIEMHVTFIQESVPELAIRYLWKVYARTRTRMDLTTSDEVDIHSALCALSKMDLLPHHVNQVINVAHNFHHGGNDNFPMHLFTYMGMVIGQACVGLRSISEEFEFLIKQLKEGWLVPIWMLEAFAEIYTQQPSILEPYTLLIVKGAFRFVRKHFHRGRKKYLSTYQLLALDELLELEKETQGRREAQAPGYIGIAELVIKLGQFLHTGCYCMSCKSREVMLFGLASNIIGVWDRSKAELYQRMLEDLDYTT